MNRILSTFLCFFMLTFMNAQIHEVGVFVGGSNFIGDVGPTNYINPNKLALGVLYKWNKSTRHSWRASYIQSTIRSNDLRSDAPNRLQRGFSFKNNIQELSAGVEFNFFDFDLHELTTKITPYVFTGLNYFRYDYQYFSNGATEFRKKEFALAIPMVLGAKSNITPHLILGIEVGARYTFTDNIDASNPDLPNALQFGNINNKDWYVFSGITLTYTFGNNPCFCPQ